VKHPDGTLGVFRIARRLGAVRGLISGWIAYQYPLMGLAPPPPSCCSSSALLVPQSLFWKTRESSASDCGMSPEDAMYCSVVLRATGMSRLLVTAQSKDDCTAMQLINHAHRPDGLSWPVMLLIVISSASG
jgi:hypothetical protein